MARRKGYISNAEEYLTDKDFPKKTRQKNLKLMKEVIKRPNTRDPKTFSGIYSLLAVGKKANKDGDTKEADKYYRVVNDALHGMEAIGEPPTSINSPYEHRVLSGQEKAKINSLQNLLYKLSKGNYGEEQEKSGIVNLARVASIFAFITGLIFLSPNITGNAIANITNTTSNWIGGILFIIGITGAFVYFNKKAKAVSKKPKKKKK